MTRLPGVDDRTLLLEFSLAVLPFSSIPNEDSAKLCRGRSRYIDFSELDGGFDRAVPMLRTCLFRKPYICGLRQIGETIARQRGVHSIAGDRGSF